MVEENYSPAFRIKVGTRAKWDQAILQAQAILGKKLTHDEFAELVLSHFPSPLLVTDLQKDLHDRGMTSPNGSMAPGQAIEFAIRFYLNRNKKDEKAEATH